jgi:hypothetical protein
MDRFPFPLLLGGYGMAAAGAGVALWLGVAPLWAGLGLWLGGAGATLGLGLLTAREARRVVREDDDEAASDALLAEALRRWEADRRADLAAAEAGDGARRAG